MFLTYWTQQLLHSSRYCDKFRVQLLKSALPAIITDKETHRWVKLISRDSKRKQAEVHVRGTSVSESLP